CVRDDYDVGVMDYW
nr:immunoglobulin heavy chain junction region [Mus musculus]MBK4186815.1 immunoglobulin heavy chain junction region [Mus musculus]MBK4186816.1 immunoglobulin heavy chain junction region [Mus musculus]